MQCPYCGNSTDFLLPTQVAQLMNVPVQTIRRWLKEERFPGAEMADIRGRKVWRIPAASVETILEGRQ